MLLRLDRGLLSCSLPQSSLQRIVPASEAAMSALGPGLFTARIEGQPALVYEPELTQELPSISSHQPAFVAVLGYDGDVLVGLAADQIEVLDESALPLPSSLDLSVFISEE